MCEEKELVVKRCEIEEAPGEIEEINTICMTNTKTSNNYVI